MKKIEMDLQALIQNQKFGELNQTQQKIMQRGGKFSSSSSDSKSDVDDDRKQSKS